MTFPESNAYPLMPDAKTLKEYGEVAIQKGLTKRELFAAMAMQGYCGNAEFIINPTATAITAVQTADALIAELNKGVQS
jgi:hypothetical protein